MAQILRASQMSKCIGCFTCMNVCAAVNNGDHSISKSSVRIKTSGGLEGRFIAVVCLACKEAACAEACPSDALKPRTGGGVVLSPEKCFGCRACEQACTVGSVVFDEHNHRPIICKHCGLCSRYCPHNCLNMEESGE